jgi:hypothetical protein
VFRIRIRIRRIRMFLGLQDPSVNKQKNWEKPRF